jgi:hypothetical protein
VIEPKVGQVWKDIWHGGDTYIFEIVKLFQKEGRQWYTQKDLNTGHVDDFEVSSLTSSDRRTTILLKAYNSPLWKVMNGGDN